MNRRDFFRRTAPLAALAVVGTPALTAALTAPKRDKNGRLIVDGREVQIDAAELTTGLHITAQHATVMNCHFEHRGTAPAMQVTTTPLLA
jgi:hypothetical protein